MSHADLEAQRARTAPAWPQTVRHAKGRWVLLAALGAAQLMLVLDVTVANVALPDITAALELSRGTAPWVITGYTLMLGGFMLLGGRSADLFGPRVVFLAGLVTFVAASLVAGLAWDATALLVARGAQGLGAAFLSPSALAAITLVFPGSARHQALAFWAAIGGVGASMGVLLGGVLTSGPGWRWIFLVNVPVGLLVLGVVARRLSAGPRGSTTRVDVRGAMMITAAMGAVILGLSTAAGHGWRAPAAVLLLTLGGALVVAFVLIERRESAPLLAVGALAHRSVVVGATIMLASSGLLIGLFFLLSFYFQQQLGWSALHTGLAFLPMATGSLAGAHLAGRTLHAYGPQVVCTVAFAVTAGGLGLAAWQWASVGPLVVAIGFAALGLGAGFVTATTSALGAVDPGQAGAVSGLINTCHEFGGALGVSLLSGIAAATTTANVAGVQVGLSLALMGVVALVIALGAPWAIPSGRSTAAAPAPIH